MEDLNVLSLNCRGLNSLEYKNKNYTWLSDIDAALILLQETHFFKEKKTWILDIIHGGFET